MKIELNFAAIKSTKPHEHVVRFVLGGLATVGAGLIAKYYGPVIGGLFLAFPAIFPAGATLIEKHEKEKKRKIGRDGVVRGRNAVALDALGASLGAVGLIAFALPIWLYLPRHSTAWTLVLALLAWLATSVALWLARKQKIVHHLTPRL